MTRTTDATGTWMPAIERQVTIRADRQRVWDLVSEPGWWINDGALTEHTLEERDGLVHVTDPTLGTFALQVVELREPDHAAFRWAPWTDDDAAGTLIEFFLADTDDGVVLTVRESGWEATGLDPERAADNHRENVAGWEAELALVQQELSS